MTVNLELSYKDSGVDWLGEIPATWQVKPFWTLFRREKSTGHPDEELLSVYRDYGVIPKSSRDDNGNVESEDLNAYQLVEPNDLVMNKMKAWQGSIAVSDIRGIVSPAYFVFKPRHEAHGPYLHHLLRSKKYIGEYNRLSKGIRVGQWDLEPTAFRTTPIVLPPLEEQVAIAEFLDRETAQIDALIAKQQQLINALKEKIQAQIKHAVTGGLQQFVTGWRQTESWVGKIPDHWGLSKLKYIGFIQQGYSFSADLFEDEGPLPVVKQSDFFQDEFTTYTSEVVPKRFLVEDGDVLVSMSGDFNCKLWGRGTAGLNQRCASIRADNNQVSNLWLSYVLPAALADLSTTNVSTTVSNMSSSELANLLVPSPPISEQIEITAYLDREVSKTETLSSSAIEMVQLLNERRQALISAAVTGKIDVRGKV